MTSNRRRGPRNLHRAALLLVCAAAAGVMMTAAETLRLESAWSAEAPAIDGQLADWSNPLVSLGQVPLSFGVRNDGAFLYVALAASDPSTRRMLGAAGFTLWWDPAGKEKKSYGVTIPATMAGGPGMRGRGQSSGPPDQYGQPPDSQGAPPQGQGGPPAEGREGQDGGRQGGPAVKPVGHIEVVGPGKDDRRRLEIEFARTVGIDVVTRMSEGVLIYEIKVPLSVSESQPYGVRSAPGASVSLGIETGQLPRPEGRGGMGGGHAGMGGGPPGGGGMGGGMGGGGMGGPPGGGGMGGPPEGGREGMRELKPIKVWTIVRLGKPPA